MRPIQHIYRQLDEDKSILYSWFAAMNTRIDLILCNRTETELKSISGLIYDEIKTLENIANYFDSGSELSNVNLTASSQALTISSDLFSMIWQCVDFNKLALGCFDIAIRSDNYNRESISAVTLDIDNSTVYFQQEGIKLDLSGYVKGYALESARNIIDRYHISDALVNLGNSSVMAKGRHPYGEGWKVGIDFPSLSSDNNIMLENQCLTISGNNTAERKHIISPYTREYIEGLNGIAVVTPKATHGEALSTALFVATAEQRKNIMQNFEAKVYYI